MIDFKELSKPLTKLKNENPDLLQFEFLQDNAIDFRLWFKVQTHDLLQSEQCIFFRLDENEQKMYLNEVSSRLYCAVKDVLKRNNNDSTIS